jgi:acyl-CoA synthetase (AMP-forming)/AMP-acid ligase II
MREKLHVPLGWWSDRRFHLFGGRFRTGQLGEYWFSGAIVLACIGLAGERLVRYKVPRSFEFTSEPVRDDAGKVRRSALRDERS